MRRLLTGSIKAILALAVLSTAAHWAMRMQRGPDADPSAQVASQTANPIGGYPDPVTTGSITPRPAERPAAAAMPGLDQQHLSALIASHSEKARVQKTSAKR